MIYQLLEFRIIIRKQNHFSPLSLCTPKFENWKFGIFSSSSLLGRNSSNPWRKKGRAKVVVLSDHPSTRHLPGQTSQAPWTEALRMPAACFSFKWFIHTGILRDAFHAFYVPANRISRTYDRCPALWQVAVDALSCRQMSQLCSFRKRGGEWRNRGFATPSIDGE